MRGRMWHLALYIFILGFVLNMLGIHCSPERIVNYANGGKTQADGYAIYDAKGEVVSGT